jgi:aarF domain-containing kinase
VETFETGEHITKYVEMGPGAPHNADLAELGSGAMLQMMLVDNLIHSDLHPGAASASRFRVAAEISSRDL